MTFRSRLITRALIIVAALLALTLVVVAQETPEDWLPKNLADLILKLSSPNWIVGTVVALLAIVSQYGWKGYDNLETKYKRIAFLAMSMILPTIAVALRIFSLGEPATWTMILAGINAGWVAFGLGTALHGILPQKVGSNWVIKGY